MTNGEKYVTPEQRSKAFENFCIAKKHCPCDLSTDGLVTFRLCAFRWLNLEAEQETPLPCPFCREECAVADDGMNVVCSSCGYNGPVYGSKDLAVEAHNMVARAVMDAEKKEAK